MNSFSGDERAKAQMLRKLARKRKWEHSHTAFDDMIKAVPRHKRGDARRAAEELIRQGLIRVKPAFYGKQVSLNQEKCDEIKALIRRYFGRNSV